MNCDEAKLRLVDIDQLNQAQLAELEQHAQTCTSCAETLASLRSVMELTQPLKTIEVHGENEDTFLEGVINKVQNESGRQVWWSPGLASQAGRWLAAASLFLAGFFVYEQFSGGQAAETEYLSKGSVLNASIYRQELNKIRDSQAYRAKLLCRSPYRKPEQVADCVRQKFGKTSSL